ncbi:hypothetical protein D3C80_1808150 [compost metagenome]
MLNVLILEAVMDVPAHQPADRSIRAEPGRHPANRDVAVGDHADQAIAVVDQYRSAVDARHQRRHILEAGIG